MLVAQDAAIRPAELDRVAAALDVQVKRDFRPRWHISAEVTAGRRLEDVPPGTWPAIIRRDIGVRGAAGIHQDRRGQPFALISSGPDWSLTASHETLEMLADPSGNRLQAAPSVKPGQGRVEYLVEVCDPSEDGRFGYAIDGVRVSDFYLPSFFDTRAAPGVPYSFTGALTRPLLVLEGGYLSWLDPKTGHGWQERWFGTAKPSFADLGPMKLRGSLRESFDRLTESPSRKRRRGRARQPGSLMAVAQSNRAGEWQELIETLLAG